MAHIAIVILDVNMSSPDDIAVSMNVTWVDHTGSNRSASGDLITPLASAAGINDEIRTKGTAIAIAHGVTVGADDVVRIFGGAVPNVS